MEIFKKYGLESVTFESLGVFEKYADMKECLKQTYINIAKAKISSDEEGSVIYFIRRRIDPSQEEDRVLSLGKLKTLEYRLYRKLREKVKGTSSKLIKNTSTSKNEKQMWETVVKRFKSEAKELIKGIDSDENLLNDDELSFYFKVAETAIDKLYDDQTQQNYIQENYLHFLKEIIEGKSFCDRII